MIILFFHFMKKKLYFYFLFIFTFNLFSQEINNEFYINIDKLPIIESLIPNRKNQSFSEYQKIIEENSKLIRSGKNPHIKFFKYTNNENFTFQRLAARCCLLQETIATLNGIDSSNEEIYEKTLILPTVDGIYIKKGKSRNSIETLLMENYASLNLTNNSLCYKIDDEDFYFLQGKRLSPTERAFFLDSALGLPLNLSDFWISSEFGQRKNPFSGQINNHNGIDLAANSGTPVFAIKDGSVAFCIENDDVFGNYIILNHDSGKMTSVYAHLEKTKVEQYQSVKKGEIIGFVGQTGMATGPHLHFEIRNAGVPQDPRTKLKLE